MVTIAQMLDARAAEDRALNAAFRVRMVVRALLIVGASVLIGVPVALGAVALIEKSARNLALDVGRAGQGDW